MENQITLEENKPTVTHSNRLSGFLSLASSAQILHDHFEAITSKNIYIHPTLKDSIITKCHELKCLVNDINCNAMYNVSQCFAETIDEVETIFVLTNNDSRSSAVTMYFEKILSDIFFDTDYLQQNG